MLNRVVRHHERTVRGCARLNSSLVVGVSASRMCGMAVAAAALLFLGLGALAESSHSATPVKSLSLASLPAGAQAVISATLGRDDAAYRAKSSGQGF